MAGVSVRRMRYTARQMLTRLPTIFGSRAARPEQCQDKKREQNCAIIRAALPDPIGVREPPTSVRVPSLSVLCLALCLAGCVNPAPQPPAADAQSPVVSSPAEPELTLNLPQEQDCVCTPEQRVDHTFLEKGFDALEAGDHIEAVTYFQRYQRTESSTSADWEAAIAIAYDSMLSQSPFFDPAEASKAYRNLDASNVDMTSVHSKVLMMRDALATFTALQAEIRALKSDNAQLTDDLAKREEALKRLRELALGQRGATP